jgi:hypothetical protein
LPGYKRSEKDIAAGISKEERAERREKLAQEALFRAKHTRHKAQERIEELIAHHSRIAFEEGAKKYKIDLDESERKFKKAGVAEQKAQREVKRAQLQERRAEQRVLRAETQERKREEATSSSSTEIEVTMATGAPTGQPALSQLRVGETRPRLRVRSRAQDMLLLGQQLKRKRRQITKKGPSFKRRSSQRQHFRERLSSFEDYP